jgi:quercetin dioxygenase-like cupin family protein
LAVSHHLDVISDRYDTFRIFYATMGYMLEGKLIYLHGDKSNILEPGDSLFFDAETTHGPEELIELPIRFLSVIVSPGFSEQ